MLSKIKIWFTNRCFPIYTRIIRQINSVWCDNECTLCGKLIPVGETQHSFSATPQCARENLVLKIWITEVVKPLRQGISPFSSSIDHDVTNGRSRSEILRWGYWTSFVRRENGDISREDTCRENDGAFSCESSGTTDIQWMRNKNSYV